VLSYIPYNRGAVGSIEIIVSEDKGVNGLRQLFGIENGVVVIICIIDKICVFKKGELRFIIIDDLEMIVINFDPIRVGPDHKINFFHELGCLRCGTRVKLQCLYFYLVVQDISQIQF
jgi:hypothetical protein